MENILTNGMFGTPTARFGLFSKPRRSEENVLAPERLTATGRMRTTAKSWWWMKRPRRLCAAGSGPSQIARQLREEQILCPTTYVYLRFGISHNSLNTEKPNHGSDSTIANNSNLRVKSPSNSKSIRSELFPPLWIYGCPPVLFKSFSYGLPVLLSRRRLV